MKIRINKKAPRVWLMSSPWGNLPFPTWAEAMSEAHRLSRTLAHAIDRDERRRTGQCQHTNCTNPGEYLPQGYGFCFCQAHQDAARFVLNHPSGTPKSWPRIPDRKPA